MAITDGPLPAPPGDTDNVANVEGRHATLPSTGFGQLWRKEISMLLPSGPEPRELVPYWKEHLHELWPEAGDLHKRHPTLREGDLLGIDLGFGPVKLATGVLVIESTDTAFTLLSPEGHMFAGWNRFSADPTDEGTLVSVTIEMRASDPFYELGLMSGGHRAEERFWAEMLWNLAARFGQRPEVRVRRRLLDRRRQWRYAWNIRNNSLIRTMLRRLGRLLGVGGR